MMIAIQDYYFYGAILLAFFALLISVLMYITIKNNAPDSFTHWRAKRSGNPVCRVHFKGKQTSDYIAEIKKEEKGLGSPYWLVPEVGIKFKPEADSIHFIEGSIPCCDYYEKMPKSVKLETVVAFSQLKDYFKNKLNIPIDGIEDLAFYVSSESDVSGAENAIADARVNSEETKTILRRYIKTVNANMEKIKSMRIDSGVFTWQTAMNALDSQIAYTSSALAHTIETVRAAERRKEENTKRDLILYAIIAFILAMALGALYIIMG